VQSGHFHASDAHVQVLMPIRPGPHSTVQSRSVPEVHVPTLTAQASRQAFPALAADRSEQVAPAALQVSLSQQTWFAAPQATQLPLEQTLLASVHALPVQQGSPISPHATEQT
jgi:hypothetical protein